MAVVTTTELANYMGGWKYTPVQAMDAQEILDGVQSELERHINRPLQKRRLLEKVTADHTGIAWAGVTPVQAVHGLYRINPDSTQGGLIQTVHQVYIPGKNYFRLGTPNSTVLVDYTGGINADLDPGVKLAIKRVAAREFMFKHSDTIGLENTEGRPPEDADNRPKGWSEEELRRFDRIRRRTIV